MADSTSTTSFLAYHYPALQAGSFVIEQEILMPDGPSNNKGEIPVARQHFVVAGERFFISPDQVFATFPPKDSQGDFAGCLPHIELTRSTFPWERNTSKTKSNDKATRMPWLALLLINENDIEQKKVIPGTVDVAAYIKTHGLTEEPVNMHNADKLNVLKCTVAYLDSLLPMPEDAQLLAHVRSVVQKSKVAMGNIPAERAVIVSRSIPQPGNSYIAHLVSLEERYEGGKFIHKPDADQLDCIVSLYSWRFTAIDNENYKPDALALAKLKAKAEETGGLAKLHITQKDFEQLSKALSTNIAADNTPLLRSSERFKAFLKEEKVFSSDADIDRVVTPEVLNCFQYEAATLRSLLNNLDVGQLSLSLPQSTGNESVANYLDFGSVPLPHALRAGGQTVSWYRGPFVAYDAEFDDEYNKVHTYQHADELVQFNKDTGLLDMTYAAAWELGRLMFINEPKLVQQLQLWKQENNFDDLLEQQRKEYAHLAGFIAQPKKERLPEPIMRFLLQSFRFINFPFNYLVPDNRLLPKESLRFFKVDQKWLRSFMYGVISIGESISLKKTDRIITTLRQELRQQIQDIIKEKDYYTNDTNAIYGVLLNSDAVSGWPALQVEAYNCARAQNGPRKQIALLHKSYLSENVMLCLFYGAIDQVSLYLPMGASHFGFDRDQSGKYSKALSDGKTQIQPFITNIIDATNLAKQMSANASGNFAVELLDKQDMVTFDLLHS